MKKRILSSLLALFLVLAFGACGEDISTPEPNAEAGTWAIYWYLCGSDLESNGGFATSDLMEMMEVALPENVRVVIQTGGAKTWQNNVVDADVLQRYVYDSEGLTLVDELPPASMGDAATLTDFLRYCKQNYPAEKTAVLFWNHGGGSVSGAAFDERYGYDALTLDEMQTAFGRVWEADENNPPLELVGFDTCLMATVDVAGTFAGTAHYLVASEEVEPANGWDYTGWLGALAADPAMDGAALGEVICDAYYAGCQAVGTHSNATLSLTDLTRTGPLLEAYEAFGAEALAAACEDPGFFSRFARVAAQSENYGGNTREQGYTNMVDLGHMARQSTGLLQTAGDVLNALEDCVLYRVSGPYRTESTGLSCYYSYNGDLNDLYGYTNVGAGQAFKYFYSYELTGQLDDNGMEYISDLNYEELPQIQSLATMGWDGMPLQVDENGVSHLTLGPEADSILAGIGFSLYYFDEENDIMLLLGAEPLDWMAQGARAVVIITLINGVQYVGKTMIIFIAGLNGIPTDYYEAASLDGAGAWQRFRYITLPQLLPALATNIILNLIGGLKLFGIVVSMTGGGPGYASHSLQTLINYTYFENQSAGYSAAIGLFTFVFIMFISVVVRGYIEKKAVELN